MATINFYLKEPKTKGETLINLQYVFNGRKLKFSTGEKTTVKQWNPENQRVRKNFTGSEGLNAYLDQLESNLKGIYLNAISKGITVTPEYLRENLLKSIQKETSTEKSFFEYLTEYRTIKKGVVSHSYLKKVYTLENHLREFEKVKRFKLTFDKIDLNFHDLFTNFLLQEKGHSNNTIGSNFSMLITFLNWTTSRGFNTNLKFKEREFKTISNEVDIIALTDAELMRLFELDLTNNPRLNNIRESFCFACFTGLRFSDYSKVKKENIKNDELKFNPDKTLKSLTIPLNDFALEILKRNDYKLSLISNQKTNDSLKVLAELAEINDPITKTKYRGVEVIEITKPKYSFVATHFARKTFVTLSLERGMRAETVMAITGHKDYKTFKRYISMTDKIKRIEMRKVWSKEPQLQKVG